MFTLRADLKESPPSTPSAWICSFVRELRSTNMLFIACPFGPDLLVAIHFPFHLIKTGEVTDIERRNELR